MQQQTREIISACFQFPRLSKEASAEAGGRETEKKLTPHTNSVGECLWGGGLYGMDCKKVSSVQSEGIQFCKRRLCTIMGKINFLQSREL